MEVSNPLLHVQVAVSLWLIEAPGARLALPSRLTAQSTYCEALNSQT